MHPSAVRYVVNFKVTVSSVFHIEWTASEGLPESEEAVPTQLRIRTHAYVLQFKESKLWFDYYDEVQKLLS